MMILPKLQKLAEGKMSDKHIRLSDAIANEFNLEDDSPMIQKIIDYMNNKDNDSVDDFLYDHFEDEVMRSSDPKERIARRMEKLFGKL